ncbi:MAG TPA: hypothetical protein VJJ52_07225 [Candidatus Nanoarchaeia archaeon]|nr:hypothetical protein [Candidatus Nanoarchaeia archaeon]
MDKNKSLKLASLIFGLVALFHLLRSIFSWTVSIGTFNIPVYFSYFGFLVAGFLSWIMYTAGR